MTIIVAFTALAVALALGVAFVFANGTRSTKRRQAAQVAPAKAPGRTPGLD